MKKLLLLLTSLLAGCAATERIVDRPVPFEVKVGVPVFCKAPTIDRPVFTFDAAKDDMEVDAKVKLLIAERHQRIQYETELEAAIDGCVLPQP